jgi:hypothetical protein
MGLRAGEHEAEKPIDGRAVTIGDGMERDGFNRALRSFIIR